MSEDPEDMLEFERLSKQTAREVSRKVDRSVFMTMLCTGLRITYNGYKFRVEEEKTVGFLLWKKKKWVPVRVLQWCSQGCFYDSLGTFKTYKEARQKLEAIAIFRQEQKADVWSECEEELPSPPPGGTGER